MSISGTDEEEEGAANLSSAPGLPAAQTGTTTLKGTPQVGR